MKYTSKQGQTWDQIAKEVYGTEMKADQLMKANRRHIGIFLFPGGIVLEVPEAEEHEGNLPPWRKMS